MTVPRRPPRTTLVAYKPDRFEDPTEAVLAATRALGCTCQPHITVTDGRATAAHDGWCALLRRGDAN